MFKDDVAAYSWLAGIIDAEGHVSQRPVKGSNGFQRSVEIVNTDGDILGAVREAYDRFGIKYAQYDRSNRKRLGSKPIFSIVVTGKENLERLLEVLPDFCLKKERLREIVGSYVRKNRPSAVVLQGLVDAGHSDSDIGTVYGVTPAAVWHWRKHYGIERNEA